MDKNTIHQYFAETPLLALLCSQNGWPDNDSLKVEVLEEAPASYLCAVSFDEIVVEGAGCVAGRVPCWGRFRVECSAAGQVVRALREV